MISKILEIRKHANENQKKLFDIIDSDDSDAIKSLKEKVGNPKSKHNVYLIAFNPINGNSTLHQAVLSNKPDIARYILLAAPILAELPNSAGKTPIDLMVGKHTVLRNLLKNVRPITQAASENYNSTATATNSAGPGMVLAVGQVKDSGLDLKI